MSMPWVRRWPAITAVSVVVFSSLTVVAHAQDNGTTTSGNKIIVTVTGAPIANIASNPLALTPTFGRGIVDYVWRCQSGTNALQVALTAIPGGVLHIGDQQGSTLTIQENLLENQALVITGPWSRGFAIASGVRQSDEERSDETRGHTAYWIRCLPHDFPQLSVSRPGNPPPGWYLTGNFGGPASYAMVLNGNGTPVWYHMTSRRGALNITPMSRFSIAWNSFDHPNGAFILYNLATNSSTWLSAPILPTDYHELQRLPNGNLVMLSDPVTSGVDLTSIGGESNGNVDDCVAEELSPTGAQLWVWKASDHIPAAESTHPLRTVIHDQVVWDVYHCNSVDISEADRSALISARHADAVYLIDKATGSITWKLGGNLHVPSGAFQLHIAADACGGFHAQHDARFGGESEVQVYDNGTWDSRCPARAVRYAIDEQGQTATAEWSYLSPSGHTSRATGSFRTMSGGDDNVIGWGVLQQSLFTEVDASGQILLNVSFPTDIFAYRVIKVSEEALDHVYLRESAGRRDGLGPGT
jgi:Arylsulfotransferase (ASST)